MLALQKKLNERRYEPPPPPQDHSYISVVLQYPYPTQSCGRGGGCRCVGGGGGAIRPLSRDLQDRGIERRLGRCRKRAGPNSPSAVRMLIGADPHPRGISVTDNNERNLRRTIFVVITIALLLCKIHFPPQISQSRKSPLRGSGVCLGVGLRSERGLWRL